MRSPRKSRFVKPRPTLACRRSYAYRFASPGVLFRVKCKYRFVANERVSYDAAMRYLLHYIASGKKGSARYSNNEYTCNIIFRRVPFDRRATWSRQLLWETCKRATIARHDHTLSYTLAMTFSHAHTATNGIVTVGASEMKINERTIRRLTIN